MQCIIIHLQRTIAIGHTYICVNIIISFILNSFDNQRNNMSMKNDRVSDTFYK